MPKVTAPEIIVPPSDVTYDEVASRMDQFYREGRDTELLAAAQPVELIPGQRVEGTTTFVVRQDLNTGNTFKVRGAYNAVLMAKRAANAAGKPLEGIKTASAGNAGAAIAAAARSNALNARVFMAGSASQVKKDLIQNYGGKVVDTGRWNKPFPDLMVALEAAQQDTPGWRFIAPFNDLDVITGAATLTMDTLKELEAARTEGKVNLFMPLGGGSALSSAAIAIRYAREEGLLHDMDVEVRGVQMCKGDLGRLAVERYKAGLPWQTLQDLFPDGDYDNSNDGTFAIPGTHTMSIIADEKYVPDIFRVPRGVVGIAMKEMTSFVNQRLRPGTTLRAPDKPRNIEPAGALSWAGLRHYLRNQKHADIRGAVNVAYVTGANVTDETYESFMDAAKSEALARRARELTGYDDYRSRMQALGMRRRSYPNNLPTNLSAGNTRVWGGPYAG